MAKQILGRVKGDPGVSPIVDLTHNSDTLTITITDADGTKTESIHTGEAVQSDFNETDSTSNAFIKNKPTKLSAFVNDKGYITNASVPTTLAELNGDTTHRVVTDVEKTSWNSKMEGDVTHLSGDVPTTRTVNGKALSSDVTLSYSDVGALPDTTVIPVVSNTYSSTSTDAMSGQAIAAALAEKSDNITIDDELSTTSENPVQNKVITQKLNSLNLSGDIASTSSFDVNATQCIIYIEIPTDNDYTVQIYSSNPSLIVTEIDKSTSGQIKVKFNRQITAGSICAVARKVVIQ